MHIAGETLTENQICEADVCVVGAGPTGITAALELARRGVSVCLIESGDSEKDAGIPRDQDRGLLPEGSRYYAPDIIRTRAVGGTTSIWDAHVPPYNRGARYIPFDEVDFEQRPRIPHSGWPLSRQQMDPYYARAQEYAGIGPFDYSPSRWSGETMPFSFDERYVRNGIFQYGSAHVYYDVHRKALCDNENVQLFTSTTVVELLPSADGSRIDAVVARTRGGGRIHVRARATILAMGGIENCRILLASRSEHPRGVGNRKDQVGRYFVDHPLVTAGSIIPKDREFFSNAHFYDWRYVEGTTVCGHIKLSASAMRQEEVLGVGSMLIPRSDHSPLPGVQAMRSILQSMKRKQAPTSAQLLAAPRAFLELPRIWERRRAAREDVDLPINRGGWSQSARISSLVRTFDVVWATEQSPIPENRLQLVDEVDAMGVPRIMVTWLWTDFDQKCLKNSQEAFFQAFETLGVARFEPRREGGELVMRAPTMHHPMGGTRMNADPEQGVVDRNCKVHDVDNLYLAGGSVFPTGSFANPTLTMMATGVLAADSAFEFVR